MSKRATVSKSARIAAIKKTVASDKEYIPITRENAMVNDLEEHGFSNEQIMQFMEEQSNMPDIDESSSDEEIKSDHSDSDKSDDNDSDDSSSSEEVKISKRPTKYTKEKFYECVTGPDGTVKKILIPPKKKFRAFIFTWNNYPEDWQQKLADMEARYLVCGEEEAPTTGTPHIQGYCEFKQQFCISAFAGHVWKHTGNKPGDRKTGLSYFAPARADSDKNKTYTTKAGKPYEYGKSSRRGKRNDIETIKELVKKGCNMKQILEASTSYQSSKFGQLYLQYNEKPRNPKTDVMNVTWMYGNTGSGKSYDANSAHMHAYVKGGNTEKWYQNYDGQKEVILEELRNNSMKFCDLITLLQPYEYIVETKGGSRQMVATTITITSCYSPAEIYDKIEENRSQLYRRINELQFYKKRDLKYTLTRDPEDDVATWCAKVKEFCSIYETSHKEDKKIEVDITDEVKKFKKGKEVKDFLKSKEGKDVEDHLEKPKKKSHK